MPKKIFLDATGKLRSGWRFVLAVLAMMLVQVIAALLTGLVLPHSAGVLLRESIFRPLCLVLTLAVFALLLRFADLSESPALSAQGLAWNRSGVLDFGRGSALALVLIALAVAAVGALGRYRAAAIAPIDVVAVFAVLWIIASAAALEEVMFRGYPFQRLVDAIGAWPAIAVLSAIFGALHLMNEHATFLGFLNTALVGVPFSMAYLRTRSLWFPIGMHIGWNLSLGTIFGLPVSGLTLFAVLVKGRAEGPVWLTGGDYGIEASLTGTLVILLGTAAVFYLTDKKKNVTRSET